MKADEPGPRNDVGQTVKTHDGAHASGLKTKSNHEGSAMRWVGLALLISLLASMWFLRESRSTRGDAHSATQAGALREYVLRSPFDAAGHLALAAEGAAANLPPTQATKVALNAATTLAPLSPDVLRLAIFRGLQTGDADAAIAAGERLAEIDGMARPDIVKALSNLATSPVWEKTIERWQSTRSPLLDELVFTICQSNAPLAQKLQLATLASAADVLSNRSFECLRAASLRSPEFAIVYGLWIDRILRKRPTQSVDIPNVFNGDFSRAIENEPFDWKLGAGGDFRDGYVVRVKRETIDGVANRYLEVELNGRPIKSDIATTMTALPRGRYVLSYRIRDTSQVVPHRFRLAMRCVGGAELNTAAGDRITPQVAGGSANDWALVSQAVIVPGDCHAQQLSLESTRSNWKTLGANGRVALDDVVISFSSDTP